MPLSPKELESIKKTVKSSKTFTVKQLLALLEAECAENNPARDACTKADKNRSHIHVIKKGPRGPETELQKKERERAFKVRTQGESQQADEAAKRFKPPV